MVLPFRPHIGRFHLLALEHQISTLTLLLLFMVFSASGQTVEKEPTKSIKKADPAIQVTAFDHDYSQGLVLQQIYGGGIGATLHKTKSHEFDITADLHYEAQQFNATADVSELNLHLIGSSLTEAYSSKWGKLTFDEKLSADIAWNNASAFSASGNSSVRMPVYKNLGFSVSLIDNFLNNPQSGYNKNSLQFSTGFALSLH